MEQLTFDVVVAQCKRAVQLSDLNLGYLWIRYCLDLAFTNAEI